LAPDGAATTLESLRSADGTKLAYRRWEVPNARATFAVLHGLGDHSGRYARFAAAMAQLGFATYAVDLRGHGQSDGQRGHVDSWAQWIEDAAVFVSHVEREASGEVVPLGHSFGGALMLSTVRAGKVPRAHRFVLSSPALRLRVAVPAWKTNLAKVTSRLAPRLSLSNEVDAGTISRIPEVVEAYRTDPLVHGKISTRMFGEWQRAAAENLEHAGEIKLPFLILAGTADALIDPEGSKELHRRATTSELHLLEGRYHEPFNDRGSDEVFSVIADWLRK
jgi:alpha-beta hydrolase superfamily lysophospholipase